MAAVLAFEKKQEIKTQYETDAKKKTKKYKKIYPGADDEKTVTPASIKITLRGKKKHKK